MTVALWCVLIAIFLPYVCTIVAKATGGFRLKDNYDPRDFLDSVDGVARRAHAAQLNSFEVTPAFAAAVIVALRNTSAMGNTSDRIRNSSLCRR